VNPYPARLPAWSDLFRGDLRDPPLALPRPSGLTVVNARGLPIDPLPGGPWLNGRLFWKGLLADAADTMGNREILIGVGRPTALALAALRSLQPAASFYDAMDDFPEFHHGRSREATRRIEQAIAGRVDRIFVSSTQLGDKFSGAGRPVTLLRNAYDMSLLPPFDGAPAGPPHLGFVGCLGGWFDWPLVLRLADAVRPIPITLVGPQAARVPRHLPANVSRHPPCGQTEAARWLQSFTVGIIPFTRTRLTAGVDPIKYYQYRGAGLPILTTRFGEMAMRTAADGTFFLDDAPGMRAAVNAAAAYRPALADVMRFRADNTWTARFRAAGPWRQV
jgi:hypothetical protein